MCDGAFVLAELDVLPRPAVVDDLLERGLEVARDHRVGALVDRHAGGRVRDVDEHCGRAVHAVDGALDVLRDLDQLRPPRRADGDLPHAAILRADAGDGG